MADSMGGQPDGSTRGRTTQTGSVIEFMFVDGGYFATSYPYPPTRNRHERRYIAKEGLCDEMEDFLAKDSYAYIINASANAFDCWIFVYWTKRGEYDEYLGGAIDEYPQILQRIGDFQAKNRGKVRSTAFGSGRQTLFLRASNGQHQWSFRWKDLPFECEMMIQDSIQQSGWKERRTTVGGKKLERIQYYSSSPAEEDDGATLARHRDDDTNDRAPGCIRFLTLGKYDAWIIYGETWHIWDKSKNEASESKLPQLLLKGLEMGKKCQWIINKVELSLFNEDEFVLVYDQGPVFYNIVSSTFETEFKKVVEQWADSKGIAGQVSYNEHVIPEKVQSNHGVQTHVVSLGDDDFFNSNTTHLPSTNDKTPPYSTGPPGQFPVLGDESTISHRGVESPTGSSGRANGQGGQTTSATELPSAIAHQSSSNGHRREDSGGTHAPRVQENRGRHRGSIVRRIFNQTEARYG